MIEREVFLFTRLGRLLSANIAKNDGSNAHAKRSLPYRGVKRDESLAADQRLAHNFVARFTDHKPDNHNNQNNV